MIIEQEAQRSTWAVRETRGTGESKWKNMNVGSADWHEHENSERKRLLALATILSWTRLCMSIIQRCSSRRLLTSSTICSVCAGLNQGHHNALSHTTANVFQWHDQKKPSKGNKLQKRGEERGLKWHHSHTIVSAVIMGVGSLLRIEFIKGIYITLCTMMSFMQKTCHMCMHRRHKAICITHELIIDKKHEQAIIWWDRKHCTGLQLHHKATFFSFWLA